MTTRILVGDVLAQLRKLTSNSVDCCVTSPPYWGLRSYIDDDKPEKKFEIGLEPTLGEHIAVLVEVFREVRRVLKAHGTCWLNYGDCYAAAPNGRSAAQYKEDGNDDRTFRDKPFSTVGPIHRGIQDRSNGGEGQHFDRRGGVLKPKDLCMIPNRLAIALQDDGWYVRSEIIWHKPNPMPESVYDRPTSAHEKVWLLSKSEDYFYNHEAIREPVTGGTHARRPGPNSRQNVDGVPVSRKVKVPGGWDVQPGAHGTINRSGPTAATYVEPKGKTTAAGSGHKNNASFDAALGNFTGDTKNARNVWTIAPRPFREAHFATFPPALAERCIKAGVPATVCGCCGAAEGCGPICETFDRVPGVVLDPFGGAGTVGLVADQLGVDALLIELNPEYVEIIERRLGLGEAIEDEAA